MPLFSVYLVGSQNSRSKGCKGQKGRVIDCSAPGNSWWPLFKCYRMVKWPLTKLSDLQQGDHKVTLNHLSCDICWTFSWMDTLKHKSLSRIWLYLDEHHPSHYVDKSLHPWHAPRNCQSTLPSPDPNLHHSFCVALLGTTYTRQCVNALQAGHEKPTSALWVERWIRIDCFKPLSLSLVLPSHISLQGTVPKITSMSINPIPLFL